MSRIVRKEQGLPKPVIIAIIVLVALLVIIAVVFGIAYARGNSDKILNGVSAYGLDLGNKTEDEARAIINQLKSDLSKKEYTLVFSKAKTEFKGSEIGVKVASSVIDDAVKYGKSSDFFKQAITVLKSFFGTKVDLSENRQIVVDEDALKQKIKILIPYSGDVAVDDTYEVGEDSIIIMKGHDGIVPRYDKILSAINESAKDPLVPTIIEIEAKRNRSQDIDIDWLYHSIFVEKADATLTSTGEYVQEKIGISFNRSEAYAKYKELEPDKSLTIPLIKDIPEVTIDNLEKVLFADTLGTFKTNYNAGNTNRSTNLRLAAEHINGKRYLPGETFSYNKEVGERTVARGFREAHVYSGGEVVDGLGGGICQISSTLYNAVLLADLEIVERKNHMFWPEYVEPGFDATVAWGSIDFQFKNNRKSPIKIVATVQNGVATVSILGKKEKDEPTISLKCVKLEEYKPSTQQRDDYTMEIGKTTQIQSPVNGYKAEAYKIYKDAKTGKEINRVKISTDTYKATDRIIAVGKKAPETPPPTVLVIIATPPPAVVVTSAPTKTPIPTRVKQTPVPVATNPSDIPIGWDPSYFN